MPSREDLVQTFLEVDLLETPALLAVIAKLSGDEMLRRRVSREIAARSHALPSWLTDLHRTERAGRVVEVVHVLGDGDNVMVGVALPGGWELTVVVYIDHNMGTLIKDASVIPEPVDELVERMLTVAADPDTEARDLDPAYARARITEAIELATITLPPLESDTWPACRPLVEWVAAMLPVGGTGHHAPTGTTLRWLRSPSPSSPRRSGRGSTPSTIAACSGRCCGSAPTTAPAIRCAGARWRWKCC
ncbi:MAG: hypothetical protein ACRDT0_20500 [Pseudonocardiaceae bacterium]